jgi:hypothetical protein
MIDTASILTGALAQALETMAFMEIMPMEEDASMPEETLWVEISFTGSQHGSIEILAGRDFAETLAENIGALDDVTDADCRDALKELSNVTCGLVTPVIASDLSEVCELAIPSIRDNDDGPTWHTWVADEGACLLNVEGHMIAANLTIHD